ncbi:MAG: L-2-hydroxyglutarate oxidase [Bernardetiaceae bacterium]
MVHSAVVVGGGIVGLATAYQLLRNRLAETVLLLEKEEQLAAHQTGHNSGVIHSGIYYKPGSLKAQNCLRGYRMLLDFCQEMDVPHEVCGKVIVATQDHERPLLDSLYKRGLENGLTGLQRLTAEQIRQHEPHCSGIEGVWVPQTGIVDYVDMSKKMGRYTQKNGGDISLGERVTGLRPEADTVVVETNHNTYRAQMVINCAGLYSDKVAQMTTPDLDLRIIPFRGEYYKIKPEKKHLVKNLIYPVPNPNFPFLGVHFTRMINGAVEAGPNAVLAYKREGYTKSDISSKELLESLLWPGFQRVAFKYWQIGVGEFHRSYSKSAFTKALQRLIPEIEADDLESAPAGVRAQACDRKGGLLDDFKIIEQPRVIHVCNAPSPAATSSLSIGLTVAQKAAQQLT